MSCLFAASDRDRFRRRAPDRRDRRRVRGLPSRSDCLRRPVQILNEKKKEKKEEKGENKGEFKTAFGDRVRFINCTPQDTASLLLIGLYRGAGQKRKRFSLKSGELFTGGRFQNSNLKFFEKLYKYIWPHESISIDLPDVRLDH